MTFQITDFTAKYSPYVDGSVFALLALLVVGYIGNWMEQCNLKRMSKMCGDCMRDQRNQFVFSIAFIVWFVFIIIYILNGLAHLNKELWNIGHYIYSIIYPIFALYIFHHLYEIHVTYDNIVQFIQLKPGAFIMMIGILLITFLVIMLEWFTLINGVNWETSDESVQIAAALFGVFCVH